ncbi:hypothetical protein GIB67_016287 [Kingdonia uniflora]|uniref:Uncharacterized protein n=1 Tax=Kingdonia uniflora TaxID=39325 RepID=A0A7J7M9B5_9MAGN|nr:hypothetical protein GIB67_016287 [Kingdonia uniflora]
MRDDVDTYPEELSFQKLRGNLKTFLPSSLKTQSVADRGRSISKERKSLNFERSPPVLCDLTKRDKVLSSEVRAVTGVDDCCSSSTGRGVGLHVGDETRQFFKYPENVDVAKKFLQYKKSLDGEWGDYVMNAGLWFRTLACAVGTSNSLIRRPRMKKLVPPSEQTLPVQLPPVGTEGVVVDVNMDPPLKKQQKNLGKISELLRRLSVAWKLAAEVLKLAAANRRELFEKETAATKHEVKDEVKKVVDIAVASRNKLIQAFYVWGLSRANVNLALAGKYGKIVFPGDDTSPVAEQTPAPPVDDDPTKEEVVHLRGKVIEMEKALSRARDSINRTQQGQRAMGILFFNIKKEDRKIHTQLENDLRHACDELERCKGHNACLEVEKVECARLLQNSEKRVTLFEARLLDTQQRLQVSQSRLKKIITPKQGKRAADTDHERQMADVIAFYGSELERVENEFRRYISSCDKENDNVAALSASNKKLSAKLQQCLLAVERKTLLNSKLESEMLELQSRLNAVTVELSSKDAEILTANNESKQWKESLKKKKLETMAANQQVLDLLKKFRTERKSILAAITEYVTEYDLQLARLSYVGDTMDRRNSAKKMTPVQIDIARKTKHVAENLGTTNNLNPRGLRRSAQPEIVQEEHNLSPGEKATSEASNQPTHNFKRRRAPNKCKVITTKNYLRRPLEHNLLGQPVGKDSVDYNTYLSVIVREVVSITFATWHDVGNEFRDRLWIMIKKVIDIEDDLEQALVNCPEDVPYDQWEIFAKQCTTSEYKETRRKYIEVRKKHKLPHACSSLGYPRLVHKMDQIDAGEVDLTLLFDPEYIGRVRVTGFNISPMVYNSVQHSRVLVQSLQEEVKELRKDVVLVQGLKDEVVSLRMVYNNIQHNGVLVQSLQEVKELREEVVLVLVLVLVQGLKDEVASLRVQMTKLENFMPNQRSAQDETTLPESNRLASLTPSNVVATGHWYNEEPTCKVHNVPLRIGMSKMSIQIVLKEDVSLARGMII